MLPYVLAVTAGSLLQIVTIYLLRPNFFKGFFYALPIVVLYQFLFLWSYSKANNFLLIWFTATALTNILAFVVGYSLYHEHLSPLSFFGIGLILAGVVLLNLK